MARTKQTARKSVGGKAPRKYAAATQQQQQQGKAGGGFAVPQAISNKRGRTPYAKAQAMPSGEEEQQQQPQAIPEITYTGTHDTAFYAHYFITGDKEKDEEVKCHYAQAHTRDPLTQAEDCWIGVSYNSKYDGIGMKTNTQGRHSNRPALNLVVALDISGSMGDTFRGDDDDNDTDDESVGGGQKKLQVAKDCLLTLLAQLRDDDAFGLVLFNNKASVLQPLTKWSEIEKVGLEKAILKLRACGGTELTEGFKAATKMFAKAEEGPNRSSRVFFLTDMEAGSDDERKFIATVKQNSEVSLWSTIIGIGMDLARDTVEETSKTPGCNYATVISNKDFREMIDNEFDYTVTPTGFNVSLGVNSDVWQLHSGYGSPEVSNLQPGGQARHSTLFPSTQNEKGETRGGLFLFKVSQKEPAGLDSPFTLVSKWDNLLGIEQTDTKQLQFKEGHIDDVGIRKAVLLVYYTDFIRPYLEVRNQALGLPSMAATVAAPMPTRYLSLITPANRFQLLNDFIAFYKKEMEAIQDPSLNDELTFLETVHKVEQPFFPGPVDAEKGGNVGGEVEGEKKRKHDEVGQGEAKTDNDGDEEKEDDEAEVIKRRKVEEADEQLARQLAAQEEELEEEQQGADDMQRGDEGGEEEANGQCVVCWTEKKSVLFLPCRHLCSCKACGEKTTQCPLCRKTIQQKTDVFV